MRGPRLSVRPSLSPGIYTTRPTDSLPWPLDEAGCRLYARARHGLWHGVRALGLGAGDELLVPAYHHGSEIEAITKAGIRCVFYETPVDLEPDESEMEGLLERHPKIRGLLLIHYLGFPQDAKRWRAWCDERDLLLIEDAAQAFLASSVDGPVGSDGDMSVFCIYKTYGVIDGAAMICSRPPERSNERRRTRIAQTLRRHGAWIAQRSSLLSGLRARIKRGDGYNIATDFGLGRADSTPAVATKALLARTLATDAAATRRANYSYLLSELNDVVAAAWSSLPGGASPFCFPIETGAKERLLRALLDRNVIALNLWSVPHPLLEVERFANARKLRGHVLGLPVHQELRRRDLDRIVTAYRQAAEQINDFPSSA